PLELGDRVRLASTQKLKGALVGEGGAPVERRRCPAQPPIPAVLASERHRVRRRADGHPGERAQPLALGGSRLQLACQCRQRAPDRGMPDVVLVEDVLHGFPEGARLTGRALVAYRLTDEHEPPPRTRAGGGEQVPVAARG